MNMDFAGYGRGFYAIQGPRILCDSRAAVADKSNINLCDKSNAQIRTHGIANNDIVYTQLCAIIAACSTSGLVEIHDGMLRIDRTRNLFCEKLPVA